MFFHRITRERGTENPQLLESRLRWIFQSCPVPANSETVKTLTGHSELCPTPDGPLLTRHAVPIGYECLCRQSSPASDSRGVYQISIQAALHSGMANPEITVQGNALPTILSNRDKSFLNCRIRYNGGVRSAVLTIMNRSIPD
jgi:hypothetical protein